jgi:transcriptional regulator with XRE-family HTH domain
MGLRQTYAYVYIRRMQTDNDLAERRRRLNLSQAELARRLGVTQATISRAETAPRPDIRYSLALRALELDPSERGTLTAPSEAEAA